MRAEFHAFIENCGEEVTCLRVPDRDPLFFIFCQEEKVSDFCIMMKAESPGVPWKKVSRKEAFNMCTCATYQTKDHYFGRNLDLEFSYQESVTITPRNFPIPFRRKETMTSHHAMIGMAFVCGGFPLYYDATNEFGLSMAGLNFPGNGYFPEPQEDGKDEISPFEFIPWILGLRLNSFRGFSDSAETLRKQNLF